MANSDRQAAVDVVGFVPAPATKANRGAADILEGQLFAYGVGSGVAVVEVRPGALLSSSADHYMDEAPSPLPTPGPLAVAPPAVCDRAAWRAQGGPRNRCQMVRSPGQGAFRLRLGGPHCSPTPATTLL